MLARRSTGGEVAIKRITVVSEDAAVHALGEANVMQGLQHDKIVRYFETIRTVVRAGEPHA